jgi:hypothetical protein
MLQAPVEIPLVQLSLQPWIWPTMGHWDSSIEK